MTEQLCKLPFFHIETQKFQRVISIETKTNVIVESFLFMRRSSDKEFIILGHSENMMIHTYEYIKKDEVDTEDYYKNRKDFLTEVIHFLKPFAQATSAMPVIFVTDVVDDDILR